MSDEVYRALQFPKIPDELDPKLVAYLQELEKAFKDYLIGTIHISGDLNLGGRIYARDSIGEVELLYEDGVIGN